VAGRRLRVHSDAEKDLVQGRDWYASRSLIAAERFLIEVELALDLVRETPERWPLFRVGMRRYVMPAFPYSIVYRVTPDAIDIYAVAHAKRRILYWRRRHF